MTTSEVEALAKVFHEAMEKDDRSKGVMGGIPISVLEAVARAVRDQDAARGGTLTAEQMENIYRLSDGLAISSVVHDLLAHAAAQGRANAALTQQVDEAGKVLGQVISLRSVNTTAAEAPTGLMDHAAVTAMLETMRERDEARSELAKAQARAEQAEGQQRSDMAKVEQWRKRATTAESAFATLRQAGTAYYEATSMDVGAPPRTMREAQAERRAFKAALDATPAEHPDTAALHELQTRLKEALEGTNDEDFGFWISTADANELRSLLGDSGPSGGGETCPMGHPCAGDSPAEVEKSRCPHSDFGDGVCTLPAGHAEPHRLSHDAPEIEDNSDSAFHTRLTASEEATLRMHINRAKAPPNDWSKHAKGCTVEWTPTPSGPTPRVWTCAPDCPSKATTPPSGSSKKPCPNGKCKHPAGDHGVDNPGGTRLALVCCHDCPCGWDTAPGDVIAEGPDFRMTDAGNGYVRQESKPTTPPDVAASEPTPEEDWRTVEEALRHNLSDAEEFSGPRAIGDAKRAIAALARLKAEPRRAAEAMRQRAADCVTTGDIAEVRRRILALPL